MWTTTRDPHLCRRRWRSRRTGTAQLTDCGQWCRFDHPRHTRPPPLCRLPTSKHNKVWKERILLIIQHFQGGVSFINEEINNSALCHCFSWLLLLQSCMVWDFFFLIKREQNKKQKPAVNRCGIWTFILWKQSQTYSNIQLLQCKQLMIHLNRPQQLSRTVHQF